jgi:DNA-nicking Smr family endonuclease
MGGPRSPANRTSRRAAKPRRELVSPEDRDLFLSAVGDAAPLADRDRVAPPVPPKNPAVAAARADEPPPPVTLTVESTGDLVRARRAGVSHAQVGDLASGRVRAEDQLDLHGHTVADAEAALRRFVVGAARAQRRCVLVIHGRGRGSDGVAPVRDAVVAQLLGPLSGLVHSLATAPPKDGGPGATYVMVKP